MNEVEAVANAVGKTAEFGTQALQTGEKAGGFFARVFKEPIECGVGILTDQIRLLRLRRWDQMSDEVDEILKRRGITDTNAVRPKLGIPLLEEAALEDEPELQKLWSRLLANAMDPNFKAEIRIAYTDIIKSLNPLDARILFLMYNSLRLANKLDFGQAETSPFYQIRICEKLDISRDAYLLSIDNLMRMQCVALFVERIKLGSGLKAQGSTTHLSGLSQPGVVTVTPLGIRFVEACTDGDELAMDGVRTGHSFTTTVDVSIPVANW